jgi:hypothetical protein
MSIGSTQTSLSWVNSARQRHGHHQGQHGGPDLLRRTLRRPADDGPYGIGDGQYPVSSGVPKTGALPTVGNTAGSRHAARTQRHAAMGLTGMLATCDSRVVFQDSESRSDDR